MNRENGAHDPAQDPEPHPERPATIRQKVSRLFDVALWIVVLGLLAWRFGPQAMAATGVGAGDSPAPTWEVVTLDGERVTSEDLRGNVVVVNFWATWCPPCRLEMPGFERVWREHHEDGLVIVGVSTDVTGDAAVRQFVEERGVTYPIAIAPAGLARDFGGYSGLPTSVLIDRDGYIRHRVTGFFAEPALRAAVTRLLAQPTAQRGQTLFDRSRSGNQ